MATKRPRLDPRNLISEGITIVRSKSLTFSNYRMLFGGIVFLESENENPPFNRRNRLENVSISVVIGYENSKKKRVTVNTFEESVETGY